MAPLRIGIIGDYNPNNQTHLATTQALEASGPPLGITVDPCWLATDQSHDYAEYPALFCSPGSPYRSMAEALRGIRFAREQAVPFLGTCGGFQHAVLEFARNVMGIDDAAHAEETPEASVLFINRLVCSLVGKRLEVLLAPGSQIAQVYGVDRAEEQYYCNFGLNAEYADALQSAGMRISGWDADGEARVVELPNHPFFFGTLFVPQARILQGQNHPLVEAFCRAAMERYRSR